MSDNAQSMLGIIDQHSNSSVTSLLTPKICPQIKTINSFWVVTYTSLPCFGITCLGRQSNNCKTFDDTSAGAEKLANFQIKLNSTEDAVIKGMWRQITADFAFKAHHSYLFSFYTNKDLSQKHWYTEVFSPAVAKNLKWKCPDTPKYNQLVNVPIRKTDNQFVVPPRHIPARMGFSSKYRSLRSIKLKYLLPYSIWLLQVQAVICCLVEQLPDLL